jgi:hypothetical protein
LESAFVPFVESGASQRARRLGGTTAEDESTFNFTVSNADGDHIPIQIRDAEEFLSAHAAELAELRSRDGVESGFLDFGWEIPSDRLGQFNRFPASLLTLCSKLGLDIEVSVYLVGAGEAGS